MDITASDTPDGGTGEPADRDGVDVRRRLTVFAAILGLVFLLVITLGALL